MKRLFLGCALAYALTGCSLIVNVDKECATARDCAAGRQCVKGFCIQASLRDLISDRCPRVYAETLSGEMDQDSPLSEDTILLGTLMPYSGGLAAYGPAIDHGVQLAASEINKSGGIRDHQIAVLSCDTATDPDTAAESAKYLIDTAGVAAIVGPAGSTEVIKVFNDVAKQSGTLLITPSATAPGITNLEDKDNVLWRTCPSDALQGAAIASYLKSSGMTKIAIVNRDDAYGNGLREAITAPSALCATFPCNDTNALYTKTYPENGFESTQSETVLALADSPPQATVLIGYAADGENFLKSADGKLSRFIATDGMKADTLAQLAISNDILCHLFGTQPASPEASQAFKLSYKAKFGESDGAFSSNSYDALYLIAFALSTLDLANHSGRVTGKEIGQGLARLSSGLVVSPGGTDFQKGVNQLISSPDATIDYAGASGPLDLSESGEPTDSSIEGWALNLDTKKVISLGVLQDAAGQYVGVVPAVPGAGAACAGFTTK